MYEILLLSILIDMYMLLNLFMSDSVVAVVVVVVVVVFVAFKILQQFQPQHSSMFSVDIHMRIVYIFIL